MRYLTIAFFLLFLAVQHQIVSSQGDPQNHEDECIAFAYNSTLTLQDYRAGQLYVLSNGVTAIGELEEDSIYILVYLMSNEVGVGLFPFEDNLDFVLGYYSAISVQLLNMFLINDQPIFETFPTEEALYDSTQGIQITIADTSIVIYASDTTEEVVLVTVSFDKIDDPDNRTDILDDLMATTEYQGCLSDIS